MGAANSEVSAISNQITIYPYKGSVVRSSTRGHEKAMAQIFVGTFSDDVQCHR